MTSTTTTTTTTSTSALATRAKPVSRGSTWVRYLLIGIVVTYVGILIVAPLARLVLGAFEEGVGPVIDTFRDPAVLYAFWLTLWISVVTVVVHAIFGTILAWVLVRQQFRGRKFLNALIDIPFAVSPVVVGYM